MKKKVAVIGAGASGLIAACFASKKCDVTIFEKQKKIGRKLSVTGNGRCNISNTNISPLKYHGGNRDFVRAVFGRFTPDDTRNFFETIGIPFIEEDEGKLFPASLQASTVVNFLEYELTKNSVDIRLHRRIDRIFPQKKGFKLITAGMEEFFFDSVIISCGSCAYPQLGAANGVYDLPASLGHKIINPFPSITPINITLRSLHRLQGIKWDCRLKVCFENKVLASSYGEVLFTPYGISGPAALKVSRWANELSLRGKFAEIEFDFFPELSFDELIALLKIVTSDPQKPIGFSLLGILKERMPEVLLYAGGFDPDKQNKDMIKELPEIAKLLKGFTAKVGKCRGFDEAVVAAGGVSVDEVNPLTMESKLVKNLYFTGEILDVDGDSGGFNLQFAWSTGAIAGMSQ
ncbi:MAG TPA: NAD(P)/FAD-dependent oxidoreductase [Spirochaetota bacterium]|nr:NAD(P)/FAD-dependent oxidoreductase [Spirochaetota bacterium]HOK93684.1 NAD(P)/FAD-dependent oxidoreductase [Spirochaetota bacterium]HPP94673.1 NAD(P)/FAD-dependent oxidoreductase [Spirochaetota bacterium]